MSKPNCSPFALPVLLHPSKEVARAPSMEVEKLLCPHASRSGRSK